MLNSLTSGKKNNLTAHAKIPRVESPPTTPEKDGSMGKRDGKAAKAKRAERRGKGSLKTEQKTAIAEGKQERKKAFAKDEEDLDALQHVRVLTTRATGLIHTFRTRASAGQIPVVTHGAAVSACQSRRSHCL